MRTRSLSKILSDNVSNESMKLEAYGPEDCTLMQQEYNLFHSIYSFTSLQPAPCYLYSAERNIRLARSYDEKVPI